MMFFQAEVNPNVFRCGIHAANAFFQKEAIKYEEYANFVFNRLNNENRSLSTEEKRIRVEKTNILSLSQWCHIEDLVDYMVNLAKENQVENKYKNLSYKEIVVKTEEAVTSAISTISKVFSGDRFIFLYASHYVAYVKNQEGDWLLLDDQKKLPEKVAVDIKSEIIRVSQAYHISDLAIIAESTLFEPDSKT